MTAPRSAVFPSPPSDRAERDDDRPANVTERDYLMTRRRALKMELDALDRHLGINPFGKRSRTDTVRHADKDRVLD